MNNNKNDIIENKPRWDLMPLEIVEEIVKCLNFGVTKYGENTWQNIPNAKKRYLAAALRHLTKYQSGKTIDIESGLNHLSHCAINIIFIMWLEKYGEKFVK